MNKKINNIKNEEINICSNNKYIYKYIYNINLYQLNSIKKYIFIYY